MTHSSIPIHAERYALRGTASLSSAKRNARGHSKKQIAEIAESMRRFGFTTPLLIQADGTVIAGHARLAAAKSLGLQHVPTIQVDGLSVDELKALALADNKHALNAHWDQELLMLDLMELEAVGFDLQLTGFSTVEIDLVLETSSPDEAASGQSENEIPTIGQVAVTKMGDVWLLGSHRLVCGDARSASSFGALMRNDVATIMFTDPPYNVPIKGHVSGLGAVQHREFIAASGELSRDEFISFLKGTLGNAVAHCADGCIAYVCMDWRHAFELQTAAEDVFAEHKNICVWNKTNGGMGTFYRSKHELVFVYKVGTAPHTNNFGLGDKGRYRTNVWDYPGVNTFSATRLDELTLHPTVKPVAMVADALRDCSKRRGIVLDPFGGSGTTLIAAEMTGRVARLIEFDPLYCDTIAKRFEQFTGKAARLEATGWSFEEAGETRALEAHKHEK